MYNALIVPDLTHNLLSIKKLSHDNSCNINFDEFGFRVKDLWSHNPFHSYNNPSDLFSFSSFSDDQAPIITQFSYSTYKNMSNI